MGKVKGRNDSSGKKGVSVSLNRCRGFERSSSFTLGQMNGLSGCPAATLVVNIETPGSGDPWRDSD